LSISEDYRDWQQEISNKEISNKEDEQQKISNKHQKIRNKKVSIRKGTNGADLSDRRSARFFSNMRSSFARTGTGEAAVFTWGVAGFRTMWAKLFPIERSISRDAFQGRAGGVVGRM
jgi:hypothetical protein